MQSLLIFGGNWLLGGAAILLGFRELMRRKRAAEAASKAKSSFLSSMSHELRTPLNGVIGMTSLCLDTDLSQEQREYLDYAKTSANTLLVLLNDILDYSKLESDDLRLEFTTFSLHEVVQRTVECQASQVRSKGLEISCRLAPDVPSTCGGDPQRLRQLLEHLLGNAIKFTSKGEVCCTVTLLPANEHARLARRPGPQDCPCLISIRDTGIGIASADQKRIFSPFTQVDVELSRRFGGTGLGLTLAHRLARRMEGDLWVESLPGQGSVFHCALLFGRHASEGQEVPAWSARRLPQEYAHVHALLAVPGNCQQQQLAASIHDFGLSCDTFADLDAASAALTRTQFDLLIVDACFCDQDAANLLELLRHCNHGQATGGANTPLILLSEPFSLHTSHVQLALEAAGKRVTLLHKPVALPHLYQALRTSGLERDGSARN